MDRPCSDLLGDEVREVGVRTGRLGVSLATLQGRARAAAAYSIQAFSLQVPVSGAY